MPEANAKVGRVLGPASPMSQAAARSNELALDNTQWDANQYRKPDYFVYIYTVSDRTFIVHQAPLISSLIIAARKPGERYGLVATLPSPFNQIDREGGVGDLITRAHIGERVAMSIVNPNNTTLDQDAVVPTAATLGLGVDLGVQGVFWSRNNPPTEDEIARAEKRRENYYRLLLEKARTLEIANPKELEYVINEDYHLAAEYFGEERTWHRKMVRMAECPACGESVKPGVAYHKNSLGLLCVIDATRAKAAGVTISSGSRE